MQGSASLTLSKIVSSQWCGWAQDSASKASRRSPPLARGASRSSSRTAPQRPRASGAEQERAGDEREVLKPSAVEKASGLLRQRAVWRLWQGCFSPSAWPAAVKPCGGSGSAGGQESQHSHSAFSVLHRAFSAYLGL